MFHSQVAEHMNCFADGNPLILIDDTKSFSHAAIVCLAEYTTPNIVNMMVTHAKGMVAISLSPSLAQKAGLYSQSRYEIKDNYSRNYTFSIDAKESGTGISAYERSFSIQKLAQTQSTDGFIQPGHIFPVISNSTNFFANQSIFEIALLISEVSKSNVNMVTICDILNEEGNMADPLYVNKVGKKLGIPVLFTSQLLLCKLEAEKIAYKRKRKRLKIENRSYFLYEYDVFGKKFEVMIEDENDEKLLVEIDKLKHIIDEPQFLINKQVVYSSLADALSLIEQKVPIFFIGELDKSYLLPYSLVLKEVLHDIEQTITPELKAQYV